MYTMCLTQGNALVLIAMQSETINHYACAGRWNCISPKLSMSSMSTNPIEKVLR